MSVEVKVAPKRDMQAQKGVRFIVLLILIVAVEEGCWSKPSTGRFDPGECFRDILQMRFGKLVRL